MAQRMLIEAPAIQGHVTGLLDVVTPEQITDPHMANGVLYATAKRGPVRFTSTGCATPAITGDVTKTFEGGGADVSADPFGIYYGVSCALARWQEYDAEARDGLDAGATVAIEKGVQQTLLSPKAVNLTPTPGTPVKVKTAVGLLEQYAGVNYSGTPLFHVSKFGATFLPLEVGMPLTTKQGTPVVNGAGYNDADGPLALTAGTNEFWLYASGQIHLWWTPVVVSAGMDLQDNSAAALAERIVIATVDQFVAAVLVTTEGL